MNNRKIRDLSLIGFLVLALIVTMGTGMYKDKKLLAKNKEDTEIYKLNESKKISENTQYYLNNTLKKLDNDEDTIIMFVGDSVTDGVNSTDPLNKSYTGLFANWIAKKFPDATVKLAKGENIESFKPIKSFKETVIQTGTKNTITIVNAGVRGDGMYQLFNRANNFISYNGNLPDCIFIMDGINDSDTNNTNRYSSPNKFEDLQKSFIDYLKDQTGAEIVIMTPHWDGDTPNSIINEYVDVQREIAKEKNLLLIDNKEIWDKHYDAKAKNHGQGDWLNSSDHIHPTDKGYEAIFQNIIDNLYNTTLKNNDTVELIKMNDNKIAFEGEWNDMTITDSNSNASYNYKRENSENSKINVNLKGNEIYAIVRDGKDEVTFENVSKQYVDNRYIKIGGSEYPKELVTILNKDMYSAHHKRVLLYEGKNQECNITLKNIKGNLDLYGFETITYNK